MTILDDARRVLETASEPLHYREIAKRMLENGWETRGKTPWDNVNARLTVDIKKSGPGSRFMRTAPGLFALNPAVPNPDARVEPPPAEQPRPSKQTEGDDAGTLSFTNAAEQILRDSGGRDPLHYSAITERAIERGLIHTEGLTPANSMYSMILAEIRRREDRGEMPRFVQHGRGLVGLAAWIPVGLAARIDENNREVRRSLLDRAKSASPGAFEKLVGELLAAMGFDDVEVTSIGGDGGIDVRGTLVVGEAVRIRMAVQAKRWKGNVQAPVVQQVRGSLGAHEQGLIITTSDFSSGAKAEAARSDAAPVALMNGERLAALLAKHQIGVRLKSYDLFTLDEAGETGE